MRQRPILRAAVIFTAWSLFAVFMAVQEHYTQQLVGRPVAWGVMFRSEFLYAYTWALLTPVILWLARRFPVAHHGGYRMAPVHIAACIAITAVQRTVYGLIIPPASPQWRIHDLPSLVRSILVAMDYGVMLYGIVLGIHYAVEYYARYQEGRVKASKLEARLAQAQLHALKMQLRPHFLFNTLHSISALVREDPESAEAMIARLSELLRLSLENGGVQEVSLSKELEFVGLYLDIEQIRFDDRLHVRFDIEPQTLDAQVPNLILQPLVENAIHHGIGGGSEGCVEIRSHVVEGKLLLQVLDDGAGLSDDIAQGHACAGVGLTNTRARLEAIYGKEHNFVLRGASKGGVEAAIQIPFRRVSHDRGFENQNAYSG